MEPKYVLILDYCIGALNIIELTEKEINESYNYEDFESFLETLEEKYGFRLSDCNWMTTESLSIYRYKDEKEGKHSKKCTFYTLRFGCSFAAVNTIKPQLL